MVLVQIFDKPIPGGFFGTPTKEFEWRIESRLPHTDSKGEFVRVGSFSANHWFHVAKGKTVKATLANARRRLTAGLKRSGLTARFEYRD